MHGCGGVGEYEPDPPGLANVLNQLVAALREAGRFPDTR